MKFLVDWKKGFGKVPQEFVNFEDFLGESWNLDSQMDHEEIVELLTKLSQTNIGDIINITDKPLTGGERELITATRIK